MAVFPLISIGDVFHLRCTLCNPPKNKFFVALHIDPLRMVLINSEPNAFQRNNPQVLATLAPISAADHPFLSYDSFVACDHLSHEYNLEQLQRLIVDDATVKIGHLHQNAVSAVREALKGNDLIARKYLRDMNTYWGC